MQNYYQLIPFLPLAAFVINIIFGRKYIKNKAHWIAILGVAASWVLAVGTLVNVMHGKVYNADLYTWITSGSFRASVGFLVDPLTAVMLIVVTTVSTLVHIYSVGYMHEEDGYYRFFSYLSLFTFSMLMLVMANNLLQLFFGWEAVGLCSYFLIGFYYKKKSAADAGKKAFIVNRFGDFGFTLGIILIFVLLGSIHYTDIFANIASLKGMTFDFLGTDINAITLIALLLFCGAMGKSAQIPLHVWLPDAMEGPTPVSALIHAATMVTAGVFMVARLSPIFNLSPAAMSFVAVVGAVTAFFAATIALVQRDIKRIIAYSTISQLGYMFIGCGVGAYGAAIFHLYTHAFFKALLFLGAGSVMHAMQGELDIMKMGGLKKYMPTTYWTFMLATLSISGIPGFAGFFSKDEILGLAYATGGVGKVVWFIGVVTALLTAFYSFRIIYVAFHGEFRGGPELEHHLHEAPKSMTIPLILLAIGAVAAGWIGIPESLLGHNQIGEFLGQVVTHPHVEIGVGVERLVMLLSVVIAFLGWFVAWFFYVKRKDIPENLAKKYSHVFDTLWNKYYVDEFYDFLIVQPTKWVASSVIVAVTDGKIIEGIVNGVPRFIGGTGKAMRSIQNGYVHRYAAIMGLGFIAALAIVFLW